MNLTLSDRRPALHGAAFYRGLASCLVAAFVFAAPLARAQDDPVVARVNGAEIRQSDLNMAEEDVGNQVAQMAPDAKREYLISFLADMMLVAKAAEAKKLQDSADFKRKLNLARTKLLMEQFLQAEAKTAVTETAMRKVYDEAVGQMSKEPEVRARHILVETEDEAKTVLAELKKGADFAELAKSRSKDPGSAEGGDLGYFTKDQMVPEFSEVAFKLDKGALSDPVKSQFGWHIIKVEEKRTRPLPTFDQVKDTIVSQLTQQKAKQTLKDLHDAAKIDVKDPQIKKSMQDAAVRGEAPAENEPESAEGVEDNH